MMIFANSKRENIIVTCFVYMALRPLPLTTGTRRLSAKEVSLLQNCADYPRLTFPRAWNPRNFEVGKRQTSVACIGIGNFGLFRGELCRTLGSSFAFQKVRLVMTKGSVLVMFSDQLQNLFQPISFSLTTCSV